MRTPPHQDCPQCVILVVTPGGRQTRGSEQAFTIAIFVSVSTRNLCRNRNFVVFAVLPTLKTRRQQTDNWPGSASSSHTTRFSLVSAELRRVAPLQEGIGLYTRSSIRSTTLRITAPGPFSLPVVGQVL